MECSNCNKLFTQKKNLYRHLRKDHGIEPLSRKCDYTCGECKAKFSQSQSVMRHIRLQHKMNGIQKCEYCCSIYGSKQALVAHTTSKHNIRIPRALPTHKFTETRSAVKNFFKVYSMKPEEIEMDADGFMLRHEQSVKNLIDTVLQEVNSIKVQLMLCAKMFKPTNEDITEFCGNSLMEETYQDGLSSSLYHKMKDHILACLETFCRNGSGWVVRNIVSFSINLVKTTPIAAGSFIPTPLIFQDNNFLLNIETRKSNNCLELCLLAAKHPSVPHPERASTYENMEAIDMCKLEYPVKLHEIYKLEIRNSLSINIFGIHDDNVYPLRLSKYMGTPIDLLLLEEEGKHHFCLIRNFTAFMRRAEKPKKFYCRRCLNGCSGWQSYKQHIELCQSNEPCRINMPQGTQMAWNKYSARAFVPFIIYADLEAITPKVFGCTTPQTDSYSVKVEHQVACGSHAVLMSNGEVVDECMDRGENCISTLFAHLVKWAKSSYDRKRRFPKYVIKQGDKKTKQNAEICWLCEKRLDGDKVYEHDHVTGELRGIAHKDCNSACRTPRFTPVVFHNGSGYDFRHLLKYYTPSNPEEKIECIPSSEETYISFSLRVPVNSFFNDEGEMKIIYEDLRFIDSFRFLSKPLHSLVETLGKDNIELKTLQQGFKEFTPEQRQLLIRKGVYPYSYMDSFAKFQEISLPPPWTDSLTNKVVLPEDYAHACNVWNTLDIENMGEYHDVYLRSDVYQLADVFENFRKLCYRVYKLDPAHYITAPNLAWDAMLKVTGVGLDILDNKDMLDMVKSGIRGGMCGSYESRYFKANNPCCPDYNPANPSTWMIMLDANNLYGGVMKEFLPSGGFKENDIPLDEILATPDDNETGYFVMVDFVYPETLHNYHNDYPLAPENMTVDFEMLSPYQKNLYGSQAITTKLMQTLYDKNNYVCHYRSLKFYVKHGMRVKEIKRVIKFNQSPWMRTYIDINTELRRTATTDCQKDLGKLLNNSVFGKSMEDLMKRVNLKLVTDEGSATKLTRKPNFKTFTIFQENLAAVTLGRTAITWNKPTYIGAAVLDLSKLVMFEFVYGVMKTKYQDKVKVLYSDTDSVLLAVETEDIYQDMKNMGDHFDFSDYPKEHHLYNDANKKKVLKMKDELNGDVMLEYVGLKPKMYSMKSITKVKQSAKGVTASVRASLYHEKYKDVLYIRTIKQSIVRMPMTTIRSRNLSLFTETTNKIVLSSYDDKRYVEETRSKAYGHYSLNYSKPQVQLSQVIHENDEMTTEHVDSTNSSVLSSLLESVKEIPETDSGFAGTGDLPSDDDMIYIPPKRQKMNPFALYEAEET